MRAWQYHANPFKLVTLKSMISMPSTHESLLSSDRDVDVTDVFSYDPVSLHLSQPRCARRMEWGFAKQSQNLRGCFKLRFNRGMQVMPMSPSLMDQPYCGLHCIHWPADGSVADFGVNVKTRITKYLTNSNVYSHQTPVRWIYNRIYKRDVIHQATCFISACYAIKNTTDMSNTGLFVWRGRVTLTN